jgi:hypothetical protein
LQVIQVPLFRLRRSARIGPAVRLILASLLVGSYFPLRAYAATSSPPCETLSSKTVKSPDGKWSAVTTEVACEAGYSFLSSATYTVSLVSLPSKSVSKDVFAVDDAGDITRPKVSWSGNTTLKINTIHPVGTNLQLSSYNGITLVYTYR